MNIPWNLHVFHLYPIKSLWNPILDNHGVNRTISNNMETNRPNKNGLYNIWYHLWYQRLLKHIKSHRTLVPSQTVPPEASEAHVAEHLALGQLLHLNCGPNWIGTWGSWIMSYSKLFQGKGIPSYYCKIVFSKPCSPLRIWLEYSVDWVKGNVQDFHVFHPPNLENVPSCPIGQFGGMWFRLSPKW